MNNAPAATPLPTAAAGPGAVRWRRWLRTLLLSLGILAPEHRLAQAQPPPTAGRPPTEARKALLGATLEDAKTTDLFTFFQLEEIGSTIKKSDTLAGTEWVFKPTGPAFRPLVTVRVWVNAAGRIAELELVLAREFINDRKNGRFANDLAKSFLRGALPKDDQAAVADLLNEIEFRPPPGAAAPLIVGPNYQPPRLPAEPSPGYRAYRGEQPRFRQTLPHGSLELNNLQSAGGATLQLNVY